MVLFSQVGEGPQARTEGARPHLWPVYRKVRMRPGKPAERLTQTLSSYGWVGTALLAACLAIPTAKRRIHAAHVRSEPAYEPSVPPIFER